MSRWTPLLTGRIGRQALEAVDEIAEDLTQPDPNPASRLDCQYPLSLAFGQAGIGLFYCYQGLCLKQEKALDRSASRLEHAVEGSTEMRMPADLFRGLAGIAWAYEHTRRDLWAPSEDDACHEIDEVLCTWCDSSTAPSELMHGLAGICLYAVERPRIPGVARLLENALSGLEARAREVPGGGISWPLPEAQAERLFQWHDGNSPREYSGALSELQRIRNLGEGVFRPGVAHGVAGIIAALAAVVSSGLEQASRARMLAARATAWLFNQRLPDGSATVFPEFCGTRLPIVQGGWCNGDLGIATALYFASCALGEESWAQQALAAARQQLEERPEDVFRFDRENPIFCHGFAGRAHLFNRLYQATGEEAFARGARSWFRALLLLRQPGEGFGGFHHGGENRAASQGLLMGSAGIGLALLAATTGVEPGWDSLFGISPTVRGAAA